MKKLFYITPLAALMLMVTIIGQVKAQDEGECTLMPAPHLGEGWMRNACPNSDDDSWISPSGEECFANPVAGTTRCGEGPDDPPISVN
jgi:hypothetical protein